MRTKQIIQITSRVIIMIAALYSVHTMMACGGSGDTLTYNGPGNGNDGGGSGTGTGDVDNDPPTTDDFVLPDGYGVYGDIDDVVVSVSETNTAGKITIAVLESNPNDQFDANDLGLSFSMARTQASNGTFISAAFQYLDYQSFVVGTEYTLSATQLGSSQTGTVVTVTSSDGSTSTQYQIASVRILFDEVNMNDIGSQVAGALIIELGESAGSITIAFDTVSTSQEINF